MRQAIARPSPWLNSPLVTAPLGWRLRSRRLPGVAVLCYHAVLPDRVSGATLAFEGVHVHAAKFLAHMQALARYCHPLSLDQWRAIRRGDAALPARPVIVTLDDGYRNALTSALPALERAGVPAAVFVVTGAIERGELLWYDAMAEDQGEAAVEALKHVPYDEWRARVTRHLRKVRRDDARAPLSPDEVRELAAHPLIEVGAHTVEHPILSNAPLAMQASEVTGSCHTIRRWTGQAVRAFAYPNGRPGIDQTDDTRRIVASAGVDLAFSTEPRFARAGADPLMLPRFTITAGVSVAHLLNRLHHAWA